MSRAVVHNGKILPIPVIPLSELNLRKDPPLVKLGGNEYVPPHKRDNSRRPIIQQ